MQVLAVNGRSWTPQVFRDAIAADLHATKPIRVLVQNQSLVFGTEIEHHGGTEYPTLERNSYTDTLSDILKPLASPLDR